MTLEQLFTKLTEINRKHPALDIKTDFHITHGYPKAPYHLIIRFWKGPNYVSTNAMGDELPFVIEKAYEAFQCRIPENCKV